MSKQLNQNKRWFPVLLIGLAVLILAADYLTGPFISFPILYIAPVVLAARYCGRWWGVILGVVMPLVYFGFTFAWSVPWHFTTSLVDASINMIVLVTIALMLDRIRCQTQEIHLLRRFITICSICKRVRTEAQQWEDLEQYMACHSEAHFSHTYCPSCMQTRYNNSTPASGPMPNQ